MAVTLMAGCATLPRNAVPIDRLDDAEVPGFEDVRAWAGQVSETFQTDAVASNAAIDSGEFPLDADGKPIYDTLALSGGGSNGSFGAGFLKGWSETGTRPDFKLVTGISTGALLAPLAFLGPDYDAELERVYTSVTTDDIAKRFGIFKILFGAESFASTEPLLNVVSESINETSLAEIARKHELGHRLFIGTTHMDAQQLVIWNMGMIAQRGTPEALELFKKIMIASASIPAAFPPVMLEVEVDGETYDEMHADGGTITQVFFSAGTINYRAARMEVYGEDFRPSGNVYVIRNGWFAPDPLQIERTLPDISGRAIETMIKAGAGGDLIRIYLLSTQAGLGFHFVSIPDSYESDPAEMFDPEEMTRLFELGYEIARSDDPWREEIPGVDVSTMGAPY